MEPYQERVIAEKKELDEKIVKLYQFIKGRFYPTLAIGERTRLVKQHRIMQAYSEVLDERIQAWKESK